MNGFGSQDPRSNGAETTRVIRMISRAFFKRFRRSRRNRSARLVAPPRVVYRGSWRREKANLLTCRPRSRATVNAIYNMHFAVLGGGERRSSQRTQCLYPATGRAARPVRTVQRERQNVQSNGEKKQEFQCSGIFAPDGSDHRGEPGPAPVRELRPPRYRSSVRHLAAPPALRNSDSGVSTGVRLA
jgi:hypothetical protein